MPFKTRWVPLVLPVLDGEYFHLEEDVVSGRKGLAVRARAAGERKGYVTSRARTEIVGDSGGAFG